MYKFLSNIYNPKLPDAAEKLISASYGHRKTRRKSTEINDEIIVEDTVSNQEVSAVQPTDAVLEYISTFLRDKILGNPVPPPGSSLTVEDLKSKGYVGVYEPILPPNRHGAPSCGTGNNPPTYPKIAVYDSKGNIVKVISYDHTI
ncbi:MAG: hypothetical protein HC836_23335 [Richelia sp. RM2_1_2]|nr:hypothetical protein [Richelia sp. RM2_1_2]